MRIAICDDEPVHSARQGAGGGQNYGQQSLSRPVGRSALFSNRQRRDCLCQDLRPSTGRRPVP